MATWVCSVYRFLVPSLRGKFPQAWNLCLFFSGYLFFSCTGCGYIVAFTKVLQHRSCNPTREWHLGTIRLALVYAVPTSSELPELRPHRGLTAEAEITKPTTFWQYLLIKQRMFTMCLKLAIYFVQGMQEIKKNCPQVSDKKNSRLAGKFCMVNGHSTPLRGRVGRVTSRKELWRVWDPKSSQDRKSWLGLFCLGCQHAIQTEEDLETLGPCEPWAQTHWQAQEAPRRLGSGWSTWTSTTQVTFGKVGMRH
jgi:hypothetical protein